jgi:hypothetical protein
MKPLEKLSIGPLRGEGPRSTIFVMIITTLGLVSAFALGQWSALVNACLGLRH